MGEGCGIYSVAMFQKEGHPKGCPSFWFRRLNAASTQNVRPQASQSPVQSNEQGNKQARHGSMLVD